MAPTAQLCSADFTQYECEDMECAKPVLFIGNVNPQYKCLENIKFVQLQLKLGFSNEFRAKLNSVVVSACSLAFIVDSELKIAKGRLYSFDSDLTDVIT